MVPEKTVFILGAGASNPYGFPLGLELNGRIGEKLQRPDSREVGIISTLAHKDPGAISLFGQVIFRSPLSVDAYLEHHPQDQLMGKAAIACALIPCEDFNQLFDPPQPRRAWYHYLFSQGMGSRIETFQQSCQNLSIITFNYDRSLEYYLHRMATESFGADFAASALKEIAFLHVYGQLGTPTFATKLDHGADSSTSRAYTSAVNDQQVAHCAEGIRIMPERSADSEEFAQAHEIIGQAEKLCFLGFGFDRDNVQRLQISKVFKGKQIFAGMFGKANNEIRIARESVLDGYSATPKFELDKFDALQCLKEFPIID